MCALYVRCALSVLQKECRKVWGARYTLGARYRSETAVISRIIKSTTCPVLIINRFGKAPFASALCVWGGEGWHRVVT